jgi:hypothetical protein
MKRGRVPILGASFALVAAYVAGPLALSQAPPTGIVVGRVVDGSTGATIQDAVVTLAGRGVTSAPVLTSPSGGFLFEAVPAGVLALSAARAGYSGGAYGQKFVESAGQRLEFHTAERLTGVELRLWRNAALSGRVVDEVGDPVVGLPVFAYRQRFIAGRRGFDASQPFTSHTDDRGSFRIAGLLPGQYVVALALSENTLPLSMVEGYHRSRSAGFSALGFSALWRGFTEAGMDGDLPGSSYVHVIDGQLRSYWSNTAVPPAPGADGVILSYQQTFYPQAADIESAQHLTLSSGEDRTGVDFTLALVPTVKVSGRVTGPDGRPVANVALRLVPPGNSALTGELPVARTLSDESGSFKFLAVPPGRYELRVLSMPVGQSFLSDFATGKSQSPLEPDVGWEQPSWWANVPVSVGDSPVRDVDVVLQRGSRVTGRVDASAVARSDAMSPEMATVLTLISIERADGRMEPVQVVMRPAGGQFRTPELAPGRYVLRVKSGPRNWTARFDDRDVSVKPFEISGRELDGLTISLTDQTTEITGVVRDANGFPDSNAVVLAFAADRETWVDYGRAARHQQRVRAGRLGLYSITGLPPGAYFVVALADDGSTDWQDPGFLGRLAGLSATIQIANTNSRVQYDLATSQVR